MPVDLEEIEKLCGEQACTVKSYWDLLDEVPGLIAEVRALRAENARLEQDKTNLRFQLTECSPEQAGMLKGLLEHANGTAMLLRAKVTELEKAPGDALNPRCRTAVGCDLSAGHGGFHAGYRLCFMLDEGET